MQRHDRGGGQEPPVVRRATRLPVLQTGREVPWVGRRRCRGDGKRHGRARRPRVVVTGCWATGDTPAAARDPGGRRGPRSRQGRRRGTRSTVGRLGRGSKTAVDRSAGLGQSRRASSGDNGWNDKPGANPDGANATSSTEAIAEFSVKGKTRRIFADGMTSLPLLGERQGGHQRAFLKIQDGCDAHCTYCIIPQLRPRLWSKPVDQTVDEARRLVAAGHGELVLTGIFIGAYGQPTALRRRQPHETARPLGELLVALCGASRGAQTLAGVEHGAGGFDGRAGGDDAQIQAGRPTLPSAAAKRLGRIAAADEPAVHARGLSGHGPTGAGCVR